jgi:hypothetical protein
MPAPATRSRTVASLVAAAGCWLSADAADPSTEPRLALSDLTYVGSIRLPGGNIGPLPNMSFDYGSPGLAFDAGRQGLYVMSHAYGQYTAEVSIPTPVPIVGGDLGPLPVATLLQGFADTTNGHRNDEQIGNGVSIAGLLLVQGRLLGTVNGNYDANSQQTLTHYSTSGDLTISDCTGLYRVGPIDSRPRMLAGHMCPVPSEWQALLGGPVITGSCGGAIISGTSFGPSAWTFDPAQLGVVAPVPATPLVYYPAEHPTLGDWSSDQINPPFNMTTGTNGVVFPDGTRTVLFVGRTGLGHPHYGAGTTDPTLDGTLNSEGIYQWYDPANTSKGCHAYPYAMYLWAYDANDLAQAAAGQAQPWAVLPYATGVLPLPTDSGQNNCLGAAYDPATGRLYIAQEGGDQVETYSYRTLIHVFQLPLTPGAATGGSTSAGSGTSGSGSAGAGTGGATGAGSTTAASGAGGGTASGTGGGSGDAGGGSHCGLGSGLGALALALLARLPWRSRRSARAGE